MAKEKELTPEQIREKQREHARKTLENKAFQGVVVAIMLEVTLSCMVSLVLEVRNLLTKT